MKELYFKCTLKSDIIISQHSATEGVHKCLDYIPGSAFLGVAAAQLYKESSPENFLIFHSGGVSFGDANPLKDRNRAFRTPASWYIKKGETLNNGVWIHHLLSRKPENGLQLKQCRSGFICQSDKQDYVELKVQHNTSLKSAYDSENRRSEDEQMFTYVSIKKGLVLGFTLRIDENVISSEIEKRLVNALSGDKRVGRSSTAQFGLVKIETLQSPFNTIACNQSNQTIIYADSRLMFLDTQGAYTCTPKDIQGHEIDYERSQIRTFRYSPYNQHRKTYDAERWGIEKGSVLVLKSTAEEAKQWQENGLGLFRAEGFGRVMINPQFLHTTDDQGRTDFRFVSKTEESANTQHPVQADKARSTPSDDLLLQYVRQLQTADSNSITLFNSVNKYVEDNKKYFMGNEAYASQWGSIRAIAMKAKTKQDLNHQLFRKPQTETYSVHDSNTGEKVKDKQRKQDRGGYLMHGIAKEKWDNNKIKALETFINNSSDTLAIASLVNLAAEMAKICK